MNTLIPVIWRSRESVQEEIPKEHSLVIDLHPKEQRRGFIWLTSSGDAEKWIWADRGGFIINTKLLPIMKRVTSRQHTLALMFRNKYLTGQTVRNNMKNEHKQPMTIGEFIAYAIRLHGFAAIELASHKETMTALYAIQHFPIDHHGLEYHDNIRYWGIPMQISPTVPTQNRKGHYLIFITSDEAMVRKILGN